jgi:hypothetical protein
MTMTLEILCLMRLCLLPIVFVASTNWVNPKGLEACKARSEVARSDDRGVGSTEENQDVDANHLASRKESSKL